jgi:hypothetical protein
MSMGSTIVGASAAAFEGSALKVMSSVLNLEPEFIHHFMLQQKELTSPFPLVGEMKHAFHAMEHAAHDFGEAVTHAVAHMNSGPKQGR